MKKNAIVTHLRLGTIEEMFRYKDEGFSLPPFPGYDPDQWGIKAHNRPWAVSRMKLGPGVRIMEVGGAYSTLPKKLSDEFEVEAWIGDDFGASVNDTALWTRWGNPRDLPQKNKPVKYVFEAMGTFSSQYPNDYFDYVFSVSTLEHIPMQQMPNVFRDMHRCLKVGGKQVHTIDVTAALPLRGVVVARLFQKYPILKRLLPMEDLNPLRPWVEALRQAGCDVVAAEPNVTELLSREILVESPDVVYRYYPPVNRTKPYRPSATLLVEIERTA